MADDIVTRLEEYACRGAVFAVNDMCSDAADEIERLRHQVDDLRRCLEHDQFEIERLRTALRLAAGLLSSCAPYDQMHPDRVLELLTDERDHDHHEST